VFWGSFPSGEVKTVYSFMALCLTDTSTTHHWSADIEDGQMGHVAHVGRNLKQIDIWSKEFKGRGLLDDLGIEGRAI
jgi:hypothetical protein